MGGKTKVNGYTVSYTNSQEFHIIKSEIFGSEVYNFHSNSQTPVIIDCGSHIGMSVLYFKSLFPNSKIFAFEPNPKVFPILEENIFINNLSDVVLYNNAIDVQTRRREIFVDTQSQWYSTAGFTKGSWMGVQKTEAVEVNTININEVLDNVLNVNLQVDLLKLDIEGAELSILKQIQNRLKDIKSIILEYHPTEKKRFSSIVDILRRQYHSLIFIQNGVETTNPDIRKLLMIRAEN